MSMHKVNLCAEVQMCVELEQSPDTEHHRIHDHRTAHVRFDITDDPGCRFDTGAAGEKNQAV